MATAANMGPYATNHIHSLLPRTAVNPANGFSVQAKKEHHDTSFAL